MTYIQLPLTPEAMREMRVNVLIVKRGMTRRAAETVVDAAISGIGCLEGVMREKIEQEKGKA